MNFLVLHGPNLNLLGDRETELYGTSTLGEINEDIEAYADNQGVDVQFFQSNLEGELIDRIHKAKSDGVVGILFNPGGYTHTSVALLDAIRAVNIPTIEVHMTNLAARESFRQHSMIASACVGSVAGFGPDSYLLALNGLAEIVAKQK